MGNVLRIFASVGKWLQREFVAAWPVFLFFLVGFLLLLSIIKLALANFSIEMTALSNAIVGALFAAKAALVLDETPLARALENYRRIVAVAVKTFFYGVATLLLGYLERLLEALHKVHSFGAAIYYIIDHANHYRLLGWALVGVEGAQGSVAVCYGINLAVDATPQAIQPEVIDGQPAVL